MSTAEGLLIQQRSMRENIKLQHFNLYYKWYIQLMTCQSLESLLGIKRSDRGVVVDLNTAALPVGAVLER